jgi:predicted esterase
MACRPTLHDFDRGSPAWLLPDVLIVLLFAAGDGREQARAFAREWQPAVPHAAFVGIDVGAEARQTDLAALRQTVAEAAAARSIEPAQIILFGSGEAGRLALDLVLRGALLGAGVIGLDVALEEAPPRIRTIAAMVRLVQHSTADAAQATRFRALIEAMQRRHVDVRGMMLPQAAETAPAVTMRAGATFLVELVAKASRIPTGLGS